MRKPEKCPKCGSGDIGRLDNVGSPWAGSIESDEEYEDLGGRWYCVTCGWGEDDSIFPKCIACQRPLKTKEDREFAENQCNHPGVLGTICPQCYGKECEEYPETPWEDPISGEVDYEAMAEDLDVDTGEWTEEEEEELYF